jgi:tRNA pseudouridine38-40 synthase
VGTDIEADSPFRRNRELVWRKPIDTAALDSAAAEVQGEHSFRAFAVKGTAPANDDHRCDVHEAAWQQRTGGLAFQIRANRFLHHMVRFLVGTMLDIASGKCDAGIIANLLESADNHDASAPAPAHGLYLECVDYPPELYLNTA